LFGNIGGALAGFPVFGVDPEAAANIQSQVQEKLTYQPRTEEGQGIMQGIADIAEPIDTATTDAFGTLPGGPGVQAAAKTAVMGPLEILGAKGIARGVRQPPMRVRAPVTSDAGRIARSIPETSQLFDLGSEAFTRARTLGSDLKPGVAGGLSRRVRNLKDKSGLSTIVDPDLHPKSTAVLKRISDVTSRDNVSFDDLLTLRQIAKEASGGPDPSDARVATLVRKQIDDFMDSLGPDALESGDPVAATAALKEGREIWRRARNAQKIEEIIELAHNDSTMYSGSGFENALTKQFRQLSRRIIKGQETSFTPAEAAAIKKIGAGGDVVTRALRFAGKLAPTGVVSGGVGAGAGFAMGGPVGAVALPAAGGLSRLLATKRGVGAVNSLDESLRGGLLAQTPPQR
jgi:hypothetical protein